MHLKDNILRAYLDDELPEPERTDASRHLDACPACLRRLQAFQEQSQRVAAHLTALDPGPGQAPLPPQFAILRLRHKEKPTMFNTFFRRPLWIALALCAALALSLSFQPVRALAAGFLSLFRVQQITLLPMDMDPFNPTSGEPTLAEAVGQLLSGSMKTTRAGGEPQEMPDAQTAAQAAGFAVRSWQHPQEPVKIILEPGAAFSFTIDREQAQALLDEAGRSDLVLPPHLDDVNVSVDIPNGVKTSYGECRYARSPDPDDPDDQALLRGENCILLLQVPSPTVVTTPDVDPTEIAEIGLRFLGMDQAEAAAFSQSVDWSSTLVIPIPRRMVSFEQVTVDGVSGNLLRETGESGPALRGYSILWIKDGLIYTVTGYGDPAAGLALANDLR